MVIEMVSRNECTDGVELGRTVGEEDVASRLQEELLSRFLIGRVTLRRFLPLL